MAAFENPILLGAINIPLQRLPLVASRRARQPSSRPRSNFRRQAQHGFLLFIRALGILGVRKESGLRFVTRSWACLGAWSIVLLVCAG
jgi:hypothetical protein